jgi:hypothetical protein
MEARTGARMTEHERRTLCAAYADVKILSCLSSTDLLISLMPDSSSIAFVNDLGPVGVLGLVKDLAEELQNVHQQNGNLLEKMVSYRNCRLVPTAPRDVGERRGGPVISLRRVKIYEIVNR